jgi:hypothetical protein
VQLTQKNLQFHTDLVHFGVLLHLYQVFKMAPHITVSFNHQSDFAARKMSLRATKYLHAVPDVNIILKMYFFDKQWKWDWLSEHSVQFS